MRQSCLTTIAVFGVLLLQLLDWISSAQQQKQLPPVQLEDQSKKAEPVIPKKLSAHLARLGYPQNRYRLETFELLVEDGPVEAFE